MTFRRFEAKEGCRLLADGDLRGGWHDIVLHIGWSRGADGFIEAELDGQPAVVWHGPTRWADDVYFKFGLYRPQLEPNPAGGLVARGGLFQSPASRHESAGAQSGRMKP